MEAIWEELKEYNKIGPIATEYIEQVINNQLNNINMNFQFTTKTTNQTTAPAVNWEQRRYEIAKEYMCNQEPIDSDPDSNAEWAVVCADCLINALQDQANETPAEKPYKEVIKERIKEEQAGQDPSLLRAQEILEELGWSWDYDTDEQMVSLQIYSPEGGDVCFEFTAKTLDDVAKNIDAIYDDYDPEEEAVLWHNANRGEPKSLKTLIADREWVESLLESTAIKLWVENRNKSDEQQ